MTVSSLKTWKSCLIQLKLPLAHVRCSGPRCFKGNQDDARLTYREAFTMSPLIPTPVQHRNCERDYVCEARFFANIEPIGLYVPAGSSAPLPSTALMLGGSGTDSPVASRSFCATPPGQTMAW